MQFSDLKSLHREYGGKIIVNETYEISPIGTVSHWNKAKVKWSNPIPKWVDELAFIITGKR